MGLRPFVHTIYCGGDRYRTHSRAVFGGRALSRRTGPSSGRGSRGIRRGSMEGLRRLRWRPGLHRARSGGGCRNWLGRSPQSGFGGREQDTKRRSPRIPACSGISKRWSNRRRAVTRSRRCGGPARACADWRKRSKRRATRSAAPWSPDCEVLGLDPGMRATACKATAKPRRAIATPTGMRSLATSTPKWPRPWRNSSR
jgi:hypothetical protein